MPRQSASNLERQPAPNVRDTRFHSRAADYNGAASQFPTAWPIGSPYEALFAAADRSFPGEAWARTSEAMQIKKHTTLISNRFRCGRPIARNCFVAMLR